MKKKKIIRILKDLMHDMDKARRMIDNAEDCCRIQDWFFVEELGDYIDILKEIINKNESTIPDPPKEDIGGIQTRG